MADELTLEPLVRSPGMEDGLQARLHDPLWLIARQWQFGALAASDGGSPALVEAETESAALTRWCPGAPSVEASRPYDAGAVPLEALVEREPLPKPAARDLGLAVEAGLHFLRLLVIHGASRHAASFRRHYALAAPPAAERDALDAETRRLVDVVAGRVPDPVRLAADLGAAFGTAGERDGQLPAAPAIPLADRPKVTAAARAWLAWLTTQGLSVGDGKADAWLPSRMEYAFAVGASMAAGEVVLSAPEYFEGSLDWYAFVGAPAAKLGSPAAPVTTTKRTLLPSAVTYRGMPSPRFWEFENARTSFGTTGETDASGPSLARLLLLEFALVYSGDWFLVPLELDAGSVSRIRSLVVTDSFGERTTVKHASAVDGPASPWRMFSVSGDPALADVFLLVPSLAQGLSGEPIEEVLLVRDEMANLAWAVERTVTAPSGRRLDRVRDYEERRRRTEPEAPPPSAGGLTYRLGTTVPDYWIPLVPEQEAINGRIRLRRGAMPTGSGTGRVDARGRILEPGGELLLNEEEAPREGARITRAYQYARWADGSTHVWIGRRKRPGRGEASSGLRFDVVEEMLQ